MKVTNKQYNFEELQGLASSILSDLINQGEIELRSRPASLDGDPPVTPAQVTASVKETVDAAWGIAEAFLDSGHRRFSPTEDAGDEGREREGAKKSIRAIRPPSKD